MSKRKQDSNNNAKMKLAKRETIVDDIFADDGKYVPYGSLDESESKAAEFNISSEIASVTQQSHSKHTTKGLFDEIKIFTSAFNPHNGDEKKISIIPK